MHKLSITTRTVAPNTKKPPSYKLDINSIEASATNYTANENYIYNTITVTNENTVLLLIDVLDKIGTPEHSISMNKNVVEHIIPLIDFCRGVNIGIYHAAYGATKHRPVYINTNITPVSGETIITAVACNPLSNNNKNSIDNILYAGYNTERCILFRPMGILNMKNKYNTILLRDCTLGYDEVSTDEHVIKNKLITKASINYIEQWICPTTTMSDITTKV